MQIIIELLRHQINYADFYDNIKIRLQAKGQH